MDKVAPIASVLLGVVFVFFGLNHFFEFKKIPYNYTGQAERFWDALYSTDYFNMVKVLEVLGGLLIVIPKTRNLGIIILAPIIVNILAFKIFLQREGLISWDIILILLLFGAVLIFGGKNFFRAVLS